MYPLIDEHMNYDYENHRYVLTSKFVFDNYGVMLTNLMIDEQLVLPFLKLVSVQVYNFIHKHNVNNLLQDFIIAKTKNGRRIIKEAMEQQFIYVLSMGDISRMQEEVRKTAWLDVNAEEILGQTIPEIRSSILYTGNLKLFSTVDNSEW
jgi:hypothetical protein